MTREALQAASEALRDAGEAADDDEVRERLHEQSDHFARLASRERPPDHGRLARHERVIDSVGEEAGGDVQSRAEEALERIHEFRETIEGV